MHGSHPLFHCNIHTGLLILKWLFSVIHFINDMLSISLPNNPNFILLHYIKDYVILSDFECVLTLLVLARLAEFCLRKCTADYITLPPKNIKKLF